MSYRSPADLVIEARLMESTPDTVYAWFEDRSKRKEVNRFSHDGDDELESSLLERHEYLIDLTLAQFGYNDNLYIELFHKALRNETDYTDAQNKAIRISVLSKKTDNLDYFSINRLFGGEEQFYVWLRNTSREEIFALFTNENLSDSFLKDFLEKIGTNFIDIKVEVQAVRALANNKRMQTAWDGPPSETEMWYNWVFENAWKLSEKVIVNDTWALVLSELYKNMPIVSSFNALEVAKRWDIPLEQMENKNWEDCYFNLRSALAKHAYYRNQTILHDLLNSNDKAFRTFAYGIGKLSYDELISGYDKDKSDFVFHAMNNMHIWLNNELRKAFYDICKNAEDTNSFFHFASKRHSLEKSNPEIFEVPVTATEPKNRNQEISELLEKVEAIEYNYRSLPDIIDRLEKIDSSLSAVSVGLSDTNRMVSNQAESFATKGEVLSSVRDLMHDAGTNTETIISRIDGSSQNIKYDAIDNILENKYDTIRAKLNQSIALLIIIGLFVVNLYFK